MVRLLPWLGLLLLSLPALELLATVWLAHLIGWWVLVWYLLSAGVGIAILKSWRFSVAMAVLGGARRGEVPLGRLFWVARSMIAALLFIVPGPITDVIGILMILPWPGHRASLGATAAAGEGVIEGEYVQVDEPVEILPRKHID